MFNNARPIVPSMPDKTKGSYAEPKAELEARKHAEAAARAAELAARAAENAPRKSPWPTVLILIFAFVAVAAAGFAVYEHTENQKLSEEITKLNSALTQERANSDNLSDELLRARKSLEYYEAKEKAAGNASTTETTETAETNTTSSE